MIHLYTYMIQGLDTVRLCKPFVILSCTRGVKILSTKSGLSTRKQEISASPCVHILMPLPNGIQSTCLLSPFFTHLQLSELSVLFRVPFTFTTCWEFKSFWISVSELLIAEAGRLRVLAWMTKVVKVWVSGGHLAELLIVLWRRRWAHSLRWIRT